MERLEWKFNLKHSFGVANRGRLRSLVTCWRDDVNFNLIACFDSHIVRDIMEDDAVAKHFCRIQLAEKPTLNRGLRICSETRLEIFLFLLLYEEISMKFLPLRRSVVVLGKNNTYRKF